MIGIIILILLFLVIHSFFKKANDFLKENIFTILYVISFLIIGTGKIISYLDGSAFPFGYIIFSVAVFIMIKIFENVNHFFQGYLSISAIVISILNLFNKKYAAIAFLAASAIFVLILLFMAGISIIKKINQSKHKFTIYYVIICTVIAVMETILYEALPLHFAIFAVVVYVLTWLLGKIGNFFKWYVLAASVLIFALNFFGAGFTKTVFKIAVAIPVVILTIGIIILIISKATYKSRVEKYIAEYVNNICNNIDRQNTITESSFFSQEQTKSLLQEGFKVNGMTAENFMKAALRNSVISGIRKEFTEEMEESKSKDMGSISFYYTYADFLPYLEEQNMSLTGIIESFGILNTTYWYIEDVAFFSDLLFTDLMSAFEQKLKTVPKLSEVPFSKEFLLNYMYSCRLFDSYINKTDLDCLKDNPDLFKEEFDNLYSAMTNTGLDIEIDKKLINVQPDIDEDNEYLYSLNHEDENGIIKEEYGKQFEQHREPFDGIVSDEQRMQLVGVPT